MEPATNTATTAPGAQVYIPDLAGPLFEHLQNSLGSGTEGLFGVLQTTWSIYTIIAYLLSFVFLYIFIYASIRVSHLEAARKEILEGQREAYLKARGTSPIKNRWTEIEANATSSNPNNWKQAIIEADVMLDEALKRKGFSGTSLGERLRAISPQMLQSIDEAWTAHKVRNQVAHGAEDFILTQRIARDTLARYRRVFEELKIV